MQRAAIWTTATITAAALSGLLAGCQNVQQVTPERLAEQRESTQRTQVMLTEAEDYLERDMPDSALATFARVLEQDPTVTAAHMGVGDVYRQFGHHRMAEHAYYRAALSDPHDYEARYYLGLMQQRQGRLSEAADTYLQALKLEPMSQRTHRELAATYLQLNRPQRALSYARRAVELDVQDPAAWANLAAAYKMDGQYEYAVACFQRYEQIGQMVEPVRIAWADALLALGQREQAIEILQPLLDEGESAAAHQRMGMLLAEQGDHYGAVTEYRAALSIDDQYVPALNGLGSAMIALYIEGQRQDRALYQQAIAAWRASLRQDRNQPQIVDNLYRYAEAR